MWFEEKTSIPRFYQAVVLVLGATLLTVYWLGILRCVNILAFVYPAFETLKALEYRLAKHEIFWSVSGSGRQPNADRHGSSIPSPFLLGVECSPRFVG